MQYLKDYFKDWNLWDWSWVVIASFVGTWLGLKWGDPTNPWYTALSIGTMLTGLWCVILVAKGRIFNYYLGVLNVLGYAYIAYGYQLYGEVQLNLLYYLPMQFVGLYIWMKNKDVSIPDKIRVKFLNNGNRFFVAVASATAVVGYGNWLGYLGDPLPFLDATSTMLSIIAMILMAWRYMEQWILWIVVDIVSVWMWWLTIDAHGNRDITMLVMWIAFLINAVYGFIMWVKMYQEQCALDALDGALQPDWTNRHGN